MMIKKISGGIYQAEEAKKMWCVWCGKYVEIKDVDDHKCEGLDDYVWEMLDEFQQGIDHWLSEDEIKKCMHNSH